MNIMGKLLYTKDTLKCDYGRFTWIDIAKGIGIILVVIGHIYSNKFIFNWFYSFHMPLFFLLGGYVYKKKNILEDLKRRLKTIIVPYLSLGTIVLVYWALIERKFRYSDMNVFNSFLGLIQGKYESLDFNVHLWFLPCFFLTCVLFNVLMNLIDNKTYIVVALMSMIYICVPLPSMFWGADKVFRYIAFYSIGYCLKKNFKVSRIEKNRKVFCVLIGALLLLFTALISSNNTVYVWFPLGLMGAIGVGLISIGIQNSSILQFLGINSIIILCFHGPVYRVLVKLFSLCFGITTELVRESVIFSLVVATTTLLICGLISQVVNKCFPQILGKEKICRL